MSETVGRAREPIVFDSLFDVCRWLRVERLERGWSMRKAAEMTGVSVSTICRMEQADKSLDATVLFRVVGAYGYRLGFVDAPHARDAGGGTA